MKKTSIIVLLIFSMFQYSCNTKENGKTSSVDSLKDGVSERVSQYVVERLSGDTSLLTANENKMLPLLKKACDVMDDLYWIQSFGDKTAALKSIMDTAERTFFLQNYGPWERLNGNKPFVKNYESKPLGANYYPKDITTQEFNSFQDTLKNSNYSIIRRDKSGKLYAIKYCDEYKIKLKEASDYLLKATEIADDKAFKKYLELRAEALITDNYTKSDEAWLDVKNSNLDIVIGPIETYEDRFMGLKTAYQGLIFIKDKSWGEEYKKYTSYLPQLQKELPIDSRYKKSSANSKTQIVVEDMIYCKGFTNSEGKTIAMSLPNDENMMERKGIRNINIKNLMKLKFDNILKPLALGFVSSNQQVNVKFDAFFYFVMFQKMSHLLGVKDDIEGKGNSKSVLKEQYYLMEEIKANMLALYMSNKLFDKGVIKEVDVLDNYVTFLAGIVRSIRFGTTNFQGKVNMLIFNVFEENGAFKRNSADGTYSVAPERMGIAMDVLLKKILVLQGNQDYDGFSKFLNQKGFVKVQLQQDIEKLQAKKVPIDVVFSE
ncbi:MAG: Zn-dependent hydrolase [Bacteroidota bacterium]